MRLSHEYLPQQRYVTGAKRPRHRNAGGVTMTHEWNRPRDLIGARGIPSSYPCAIPQSGRLSVHG